MLAICAKVTTESGLITLCRNLNRNEGGIIYNTSLVVAASENMYLAVRNRMDAFFDSLEMNSGNVLVILAKKTGYIDWFESVKTKTNEEYLCILNENVVLRDDAVGQIMYDYGVYRTAGLISGLRVDIENELKVDNIYNPSVFYEYDYRSIGGLESVDTAGLDFIVTKKTLTDGFDFTKIKDRKDSRNYGLYLRRLGYQNYVDSEIKLTSEV